MIVDVSPKKQTRRALLVATGLFSSLLISPFAWTQTYQTTTLIQAKENINPELEKWGLRGDARAAGDVLKLAGYQGFGGYSASLKNHKALGREGDAWVVWDTQTGKKLVTLQDLKEDLRHSAFSADGMRMVTVAVKENDTARVWDVASGQERFNLKETWWATLSPDGNRLATVSYEDPQMVHIRDANTGRALFTLQGHKEEINRVAYSSDGKFIVTASYDDTARVWEAKNGVLVHVLKGHTDDVNHAAFSMDGKQAVTVSDDNTARVWDTKTGATLHILKGHTSAVHDTAFDAEGTRIATVSVDGSARVWDTKTGAPLAMMKLSGHGRDVAFASTGHLVTTTKRGTVQV